jgi:hypothetical protein
VDEYCTLTSTSGKLVAKKIGRNGTINVSQDAEIKESIGAESNLTSEYGLSQNMVIVLIGKNLI